MNRIDELLAQRKVIDEELAALKAQAESELEQAQERIATLAAVLGQPGRIPVRGEVKLAPRTREPIDETDFGNGIGEPREQTTSAQSFTDELAELRARSQARRRR